MYTKYKLKTRRSTR